MTKYLTSEQVITLNYLSIKRITPKEEIRVKYPSLLKSAIHRPQQSLLDEDAYPTIWLKAAALFESLAKNHAFVGGNKRTALSALYQFLWINGLELVADSKELEDFVVAVVTKKEPAIALSEIAACIEINTKKRNS